jgi:hypothetical protein
MYSVTQTKEHRMPTLLKHITMLLLAATISFASIGKISAMNGDISISRDSKVVKASAGTTLEQKDVIKSSKGSTAQIVFNDNTIITVGSATTFKVEEYLFDEKNPNVKFKVEEGSFKAITGRIGKIAPDKFKLETKTATIGIRGTAFVGSVDAKGNLRVACTKGAITLTPPNTPNTPPPPPTVVPAGQITNADNKGVEPPKVFTPKDLKELGSGLGEYAKKDKEPNIEGVVKTTTSDVKDKVGETINKVVEQINNGSGANTSWAAAYGDDYVPGSRYIATGSRVGYAYRSSGYQALDDINSPNGAYNSFKTAYGDSNTSKVWNGMTHQTDLITTHVISTTVSGQDAMTFVIDGHIWGYMLGGPTTTITTDSSYKMDYVSWGYWETKYPNSTDKDFGFWVGGALTKDTEIDALVATNSSAHYVGKSMGNVVAAGQNQFSATIDPIAMDASNKVDLSVNFGSANPISGSIAFRTNGGQNWNLVVGNSSQINKPTLADGANGATPYNTVTNFQVNNFGANSTVPITGVSTTTTGFITGNFYGPKASAIGGSFTALNTDNASNSAIASGVFKASKQ